ncbi:hypothetical protein [Brevibacillus sp. MS2.2]|uniref:hypothetical protein n=1 Tax=Brevibacillus sp. MS2.2 TaxID=2738981 RepID=UPI00156B0520|nr:hypothetical protein [Brevibacillus sp. MS2.2]NRR24766.1 hypothetical protein [Brevibacillus sp. MS2.2]
MIKNKRLKLLIILGVIFVIVFSILFGVSSIVLNSKHSEEIENKITSIGGILVDYQKVNVQESPFASDSRGANTIYRVTYSKDGIQKITWYRAINNPLDIHHPSSKTLGEEWIFEK